MLNIILTRRNQDLGPTHSQLELLVNTNTNSLLEWLWTCEDKKYHKKFNKKGDI